MLNKIKARLLEIYNMVTYGPKIEGNKATDWLEQDEYTCICFVLNKLWEIGGTWLESFKFELNILYSFILQNKKDI